MGELLLKRAGGLLATTVDDELVALHVESGTCLGFNATASRIWELLATPVTKAQLCAALAGEFDVSADQCEQDVLDLIGELEHRCLISVERL